MLTTKRIIQAALVAFAFSMLVPVVARLAAQQRSGYVVAWSESGDPYCADGNQPSCPGS